MRQELELLETQAKITDLRRQIGATSQGEMPVPVMEAWGDLVDRREYLTDTPGFYNDTDLRIARPTDRLNGDNFPHWQTAIEHDNIRGIARSIH